VLPTAALAPAPRLLLLQPQFNTSFAPPDPLESWDSLRYRSWPRYRR